jgi:hypothetical protein
MYSLKKISLISLVLYFPLLTLGCEYPEELQMSYFASGWEGSIESYIEEKTSGKGKEKFPASATRFPSLSAHKESECFPPIEKHSSKPSLSLSDSQEPAAPLKMCIPSVYAQPSDGAITDPLDFSLETINLDTIPYVEEPHIAPSRFKVHTYDTPQTKERAPTDLPVITPAKKRDFSSFTPFTKRATRHDIPFTPSLQELLGIQRPIPGLLHVSPPTAAPRKHRKSYSLKEASTSHFHAPLLTTLKDRERILGECLSYLEEGKERLTYEEVGALIRCLDDKKNKDLQLLERILKRWTTLHEVDELGKNLLWHLIPSEGNCISLEKLKIILKRGVNPCRRHIGQESFKEYLENPLNQLERENALAAAACCLKFLDDKKWIPHTLAEQLTL